MSLAWRILLFALLLNVLTVGSVQIVVHEAQQRWFEQQREVLPTGAREQLCERVVVVAAMRDKRS